MASRSSTHAGGSADPQVRGREIAGIVLLAIGLFLTASLLSLQLGTGTLMGPLGRFCARALYAGTGIGAHLVTAMMILLPIRLLAGRRIVRGIGEAIGLVLLLVSLTVMLHLVGRHYRIAGYGPGGLLGEMLAEVLRAAVSTAGTALVGLVGLALGLVITTGMRMATIGRHLGAAGRWVGAGIAYGARECGRFALEVIRAILPEKEDDVPIDVEAPVVAENEPTRIKRRRSSPKTPKEEDATVVTGAPDVTIDIEEPVELVEAAPRPVELPLPAPIAEPVIVEPQ